MCLECGALYVYSHTVDEDSLALCRADNPDACGCGHSIQHEHDQYGCIWIGCMDTCKTKGPTVV